MVMLFVMAACGGEDSTATPTKVPATATPTATLAPGVPTPTPAPATPTPAATPTPSFDAASYFKGKTIRIVANSNPGGGTDAQGRVMSAFLSAWIPGNPRIVFSNNGNKPLGYIYAATQAPKDGTYVLWDSSPTLGYGFSENTNFIKRSSFQFIGSTIDPTRAFFAYDPVKHLGAASAEKCLWEFSGVTSTGAGDHGEFLMADEISDISEGNPLFTSVVYAAEQLNIPLTYYAFDTVDTNAIFTMWARGDINSVVQPSYWYRFPKTQPDWLSSGLVRQMAAMGPGQLGPNSEGPPPCGDIRDHFNEEQKYTFNAMTGPTSYMLKALWLPPGTPDDISDALSAGIERAFAEDQALREKYAAISGEEVKFTSRVEGTASTLENELLYEGALTILDAERDRILEKYFPQYISN
jgi:hypothetical protein